MSFFDPKCSSVKCKEEEEDIVIEIESPLLYNHPPCEEGL
jgi:hypothetical protein